jgi:hypothetical protein
MDYMKAFPGLRGSGKSSELVKLAAAKGYYIVCSDLNRRTNLLELARFLNVEILMPVTFSTFMHEGLGGREVKGVLFDDLDDILRLLSPYQVVGFSYSTGDHKED